MPSHIVADLTTGTEVSISNGRQTWRADEPPDAGGTDTGPTPYELLVGALAGCTLITLALYCRHKGIPLRSVSATYEFERVHADDCEDGDEGSTGYVECITSHVRIAGDLDEAQRTRLAQIVERCPVHRTLANGVRMVDRTEFT